MYRYKKKLFTALADFTASLERRKTNPKPSIVNLPSPSLPAVGNKKLINTGSNNHKVIKTNMGVGKFI